MAREVLLVVPEAPAPQKVVEVNERKLADRPLRLGILDNTKSNADHLLTMLMDGLKAQFPVASIKVTRKAHASQPAPKEILDELERDADLVVSAMAD